MEPIKYALPKWAQDEDLLASGAIAITSLGAFLGVLADITEITRAAGGVLRSRDRDLADLSVDHLVALQRYVPRQMVLMSNIDAQERERLGVAADAVIFHPEWLLEFEDAALTLAHILTIDPTIRIHETHPDVGSYREFLNSFARHAHEFYERTIDPDVSDSTV